MLADDLYLLLCCGAHEQKACGLGSGVSIGVANKEAVSVMPESLTKQFETSLSQFF
jgi:hypothetical protein